MTKNFVTRALMVLGLLCVGTIASYAQQVVASSNVRRVAAGAENKQPLAASTVIVDGQGGLAKSAVSLNLTAEQRTAIGTMNSEAAVLQAERSRLWAEYNAVVARPDFDDAMSAAEAAPRMLRIVAINNQLSAVVARQDRQLNSLLTPSQRSTVAQLVAQVKSAQ